ncbi:MAG: hypothetical protein ACLFUU_03165 [Desulfobacteraceae bacterium]
MVITRIEHHQYFAQCQHCGRWLTVGPRPGISDCAFLYLEAEFSCCQVSQRAIFALEKDYEYFQG